MDACDLKSESSLSCISSSSPIQSLDLSSCHRCGLRFPISDTIDRFRTLDSQWRIVILCYDCMDCVKSAKLDAEKFLCVDCCPVRIFRAKDFYKSGSRTGVTSISEKEVITEGNWLNKTKNRAMVGRSPTVVAKTALGAVHSVSLHSQNNIVPDQELALCLHRSMNGSLRNSRSFCLKEETRLHVLRRARQSSCSVGRVSDSNSHHVKIEGYSESKSLIEDRETSQSILTESLLTMENEDQLKQLTEYNTEGPDGFSLKEKDILSMYSDTTSDCSNVGSALLPMNGLSNNTMPLTKFTFGDGEGSYELQRKAIDAAGPDMCAKKYFRRQCRSGRFLVGS